MSQRSSFPQEVSIEEQALFSPLLSDFPQQLADLSYDPSFILCTIFLLAVFAVMYVK
jgi:hypothetical protein